MRIQIFQHESSVGPEAIEPLMKARGAELAYTRFYQGDELPPLDSMDGLIAMGGGMSVNDEALLPWLRPEKEFIARAIDRGMPVFGVCLGAQLMSAALGGRVSRNREREIGWFPVTRTPGAETHPLGACLPETAEVFQWHGETFTLPPGGVHLLRSEACENQAFRFGDRALGVQFHPETTPDFARRLIAESPGDQRPGPFVQNPLAMLADPERFARLNTLLDRMLGALFR